MATRRWQLHNRRLVRLLAVGTAIVLAFGWLLYTQPHSAFASAECQYAGVRIYEDALPTGNDFNTTCSSQLLNPTLVKRSDLSGVLSGLHDGCNAGLIQHGSWNDCVSGIRTVNLPSAYKAVFYINASYSGQVACIDTNGTSDHNVGGLANDSITSFRILSGSC